LNSKTRIGAKRISRSVDDYKIVVEKLATTQVFPEFVVDTLFEIISQHPVSLTFTFEGGDEQVIQVHNYFVFTPPSDVETTIEVENTHTADNEIRMFIA
jgi:hypothetical protein